MSLQYGLGLDNEQLKRDAQQASMLFKNIGDAAQAQSSRIDNQFRNAFAFAGGTAAAGALVNQLISVRGEFQQLEIAFTTMLKSKEKSDALMQDITEFAATTPFDLKQVAGGTKQLLAYGFAASDMKQNLSMLGNVASGVGSQISDLIYLYGTLKASGRVTQMDINQFAGRGIPIYEELSKVLGVGVDQVRSFVSAGRVGFPEIEKAFQGMTGQGGLFNNLMQEQAKSLTGQISNLGDSVDKMFNEIGKSSEGVLSEGITLTASLVANYEEVGKVLLGIVATYGAYKAAVIALNVVQAIQKEMQYQSMLANIGNTTSNMANAASIGAKTVSTAGLTTAQAIQAVVTSKLTAIQAMLNTTMLANPYVLVATLLVGTIAAVVMFTDTTTAAEKAQKEYNDEKERAAELEGKHKEEIEKLIEVATNQALADLERVSALQELKVKYPEIFKQYDIESLKLADILSIKKQIAESDSKKKTASNKETVLDLDAQIAEQTRRYNEAKSTGYMSAMELRQMLDKVDVLKAKKQRYEQDVESDNANQFLAGVSGFSNKQLANEIKAREQLIAQIGNTNKVGKLGNLGAFTKAELEAQNSALKSEQDKRNRIVTTGSKDLADANAELKKLQKQRSDILTSKLAPADRKKQLEDLDAQITEVEKKVKLLGGGKKSKTVDKSQKIEDETEKQARDKVRSDEDLAFQIRQSSINSMKDGSTKELEQLKLNYDIKMKEIDRQREDELLKLIKFEEDKWRAKGGKGKFDSSNIKLDEKTIQSYDSLKSNTTATYDKDKNVVVEKEKQKLNELLKEFETFKQKRERISKEYDDKIILLGGNEANVKVAEGEKQSALDAIDKEIADKEITFRVWAERITQMGLKELISALETAESTLAASTGTDEEKAILRTKIKNLKEQISTVQANGGEDPKKDLKDTLEIMSNVNNEIGGMIDNFDGLSDSTKNALKAAGSIAGAVISSITGIIALSATGAEAIKGVERASVILGIIGAAISVVTIIINLIKSAEEKRLAAEKAIADAQREEYLGIVSYNEELRKKYDWTQKIGESTLDYIKRQGEELKKQSKESELSQEELLAKLQKEKYVSGQQKDWSIFGYGDAYDVYSSLAGKTYEEISKLAAEGKLSEEGQKYYEALKAAKEEGDDLAAKQEEYLEKMREVFTGTTSQSVADSIIEGFKAGKRSAADFADTFESLMQGAVQSSLKQLTDESIRNWYVQFAELSKDGLTPEEQAMLKNSWTALISETAANAKNLESVTGVSITDSSAKRTGDTKGIAQASQDSVNELNGRFTTIQGHTFKIAESMDILKANSAQALKHLAGIETNTARLENIESSMGSVKLGIETINIKGVKLQ